MKYKSIPTVRIFDENRAKEFYIDFLGMKVDWEHRFEENFPIYMQVSKDDLVIHLSEHSGDCTPGSRFMVYTEELDKLFEELKVKNYKYFKPSIKKMPWGSRVIELTDPFSNKIVFNEDAKS